MNNPYYNGKNSQHALQRQHPAETTYFFCLPPEIRIKVDRLLFHGQLERLKRRQGPERRHGRKQLVGRNLLFKLQE